jgi:hypothetical protein
LKKPIATVKKFLKPLSWIAIALFLLLSPCQLLSSESLQDSLELEECLLTADEVENFSEFKTTEASGVAEQSTEGNVVQVSRPVEVVLKTQQTTNCSTQISYKIPRTILFRVFRI